MNYQQILREINDELEPYRLEGRAADYIPELARVDPNKFGISLVFLDGRHYAFGDHAERFSIQSISKVFGVAAAFALEGEALWKRVGVEPAGARFNSLVQLEYENGIPRNPFINAGAIVVCDVLISRLRNPKSEMRAWARRMSGCPDLDYNPLVAASERETGFRNAALANFLKSFGNLHNEVDEVLDLYFHLCALELSCDELARSFLFFANHGQAPNLPPILTRSQTKRLNALMQTCGFYDEAGEFSFRVGLPGKSGVGGGIVAVHPQHYSVAVWSPRLNKKGNSVLGMHALELLTSKSGLSIF
jgi:glutaminase